ncbi:Crp/Fnr family transcriptional regulator [Spirochaeta cellobiosiphila]|uniref:Crp/Fnr family transcriptional regulator n=1 Tax=Spirochaeta cellobiosiphila TaxID=504483 RepID=UPI00041F8478|nr:Crp/Fnr family transcriptional regulator [Spirochaeta cellobiosiphila]
MIDNFIITLEKLNTIHTLTKSQESHICSLFHNKKLFKGEYLVFAGEESDLIGYMIKGNLRYYYLDETGKEYTKYFCQKGHFVSSYVSVIKGEPSSYSIQALTDIEIVIFSYRKWTELMLKDKTWAYIALKILEESQIIGEARERSLVLNSATERYEQLIDSFPNIEKIVHQYDIANYLGITSVALSRIRKKIKNIT